MPSEKFFLFMRRTCALSCLLLGYSLSASPQQNMYTFSLEPADGHIVMTIQTAEPLPCIGYTIRNRVQWEEDTMVVILNGFVRPIPCVEGLEPASARIEAHIKSKKVFYLKFLEDTFTDLWEISAVESGFRALPVRSMFTSYSK